MKDSPDTTGSPRGFHLCKVFEARLSASGLLKSYLPFESKAAVPNSGMTPLQTIAPQ